MPMESEHAEWLLEAAFIVVIILAALLLLIT